ncbi:MAG: DUF1289 domain-containing protein [Pseudomonadales bacterium]|nr:DUF1289 domain-containing protein [Pseudomonadales bacterium]
MKQIEFFEINNPCIGVCQNGPRGFCRGCFRSREERQHWNQLEQEVKRQIIKACGQRELRVRLAKRAKPVAASDSSQSDLL